MNFFEHQDRARRRTRLLVVLFALAVISIVLVVDLVALFVLRFRNDPTTLLLAPVSLSAHLPLLIWVSALTAGFIALASLFRILSLRGGGGAVARGLGGVLVGADTTDPQLQRLRNVVEEMAIAAGVPVPEIYVLEQEEGINAFAAGYSPADAAVAVTGGALRTLSRSQLQGMVAHELSHVLNGDMRLNIRVIGILFGILVLGLIGRLMLSARHARTSRGSAAVVAIALALILTGYVGLFFGRLIRASVSRQRELLADASAVQFTREPSGIAGALKAIAASRGGSVLAADTEEIGHMLFAPGLPRQLLATHPPILERIRAIEPDFDPAELEALRARNLSTQRIGGGALLAAPARGQGSPDIKSGAAPVIAGIGHPDAAQIRAAAALARALPDPLERAARSTEWVVAAICHLLMDRDPEVRERQLLMVAETLGIEGERQVSTLLGAVPSLGADLRLPLLEIAFPTLRRRPHGELDRLVALTDRLIHADSRVAVFEYALARLLSRQIRDAIAPTRARGAGTARLTEREREAGDLLMILALQGAPGQRGAREAYAAGLAVLGIDAGGPEPRLSADWSDRLDRALASLDALRMEDKERLLRALIATVAHAGVSRSEIELLRAIVAALHVPMPLLS